MCFKRNFIYWKNNNIKNKDAEFKFEQCIKFHEVLRNRLKKRGGTMHLWNGELKCWSVHVIGGGGIILIKNMFFKISFINETREGLFLIFRFSLFQISLPKVSKHECVDNKQRINEHKFIIGIRTWFGKWI